jgi:hypothetical protein
MRGVISIHRLSIMVARACLSIAADMTEVHPQHAKRYCSLYTGKSS